jgi:hypothetical protein
VLQRLRETFLRLLASWQPPPPEAPGEPLVGVRHPRWSGPGGRSSAVALMEPEPEVDVRAIGRSVSGNVH